jgi:maleylacetoacetate isomerase
MRLYGYWRSSSSWRVRIALGYKRQAYENVPVDLRRDGGEQFKEHYRAINPFEQVPVLEVEEDGALKRITQSIAIIEYLDERYPDPPLLPANRLLRARARAFAEMINSGIQPLQNLAVLRRVKHEFGADEQTWAHHFVGRGLRALEAAASETAGRFLVGDSVTIADVCLVPQLFGARRFGVNLAELPTLVRVEAACAALPAFAAAEPERQPDAAP